MELLTTTVSTQEKKILLLSVRSGISHRVDMKNVKHSTKPNSVKRWNITDIFGTGKCLYTLTPKHIGSHSYLRSKVLLELFWSSSQAVLFLHMLIGEVEEWPRKNSHPQGSFPVTLGLGLLHPAATPAIHRSIYLSEPNHYSHLLVAEVIKHHFKCNIQTRTYVRFTDTSISCSQLAAWKPWKLLILSECSPNAGPHHHREWGWTGAIKLSQNQPLFSTLILSECLWNVTAEFTAGIWPWKGHFRVFMIC